MTDDTKTLRDKFDGNKADLAEPLQAYIEGTCPSMGGNYTQRACHDNASRLYALYKQFRDSPAKENNVVFNTLTSILRDMAINCGNKTCGKVMEDIDTVINYLRKQPKEEVKPDGK